MAESVIGISNRPRIMNMADEINANSRPLPKRTEAEIAAAAGGKAVAVRVSTDSLNDTNQPWKNGRPMRNFEDHL